VEYKDRKVPKVPRVHKDQELDPKALKVFRVLKVIEGLKEVMVPKDHKEKLDIKVLLVVHKGHKDLKVHKVQQVLVLREHRALRVPRARKVM
jgi:hypothetical protein